MRGTFFRRLRTGAARLFADQRGNTLILTGAALLPLLAIVGSSVDIGRAYMTKLRLQQACDAGVLAGRRAMAGGEYDATARAEADKMFQHNFSENIYGSKASLFESEPEGASDVIGTATAILPTTVMAIFGNEQFNLTVNCGARLEISNTDVMLVLDVTGSMAGSRLTALQNASNLFLNTLLSADAGDGVLRVGVVPYASTANVGQILYDANPAWLSDTVTVPSREYYLKQYTEQQCDRRGCQNVTVQEDWYRRTNRTFDVRSGKSPKAGVSLTFNTGRRGANVSTVWEGCVMERATVPFGATSAPPSGALDMDIASVPTSGDDTKWKLFLPQFAYNRPARSSSQAVAPDSDTQSNTSSFGDGACPAPAMKLTTMDNAGVSRFRSLIGSLQAAGNTYHDAGMAWGARLISPNGLFADENAEAENGRPIGRHVIFMTDGDINTPVSYYAHQGLEQAIERIGTTSSSEADRRHSNRFVQLCNRSRAEGVIVWVIGFGGTISDDVPLNACATPGKAFQAGTNEQLENIFKSIAGQISRLRLSK
ncbi:MAG: TadE/TadG family type IV pilus assembly protein [Sphingopyxis sp.]|uniref:TadE/TadG family type IV pilus assembly protein n=1 Tax=Sphingopyxis sp. TaxID=1908224 RepID=UPI002ABA9A69|nr:TadE/TadG family type IV pilus assembly protein [Sphingopyxis sp.]MDZ3830561.1 TadE/TadG family type IV pilus assembly protein [Sphingopyxis sp.]